MTRAPAARSIRGAIVSRKGRPVLTQALIVNALVLVAVLESDLGRGRKISRLRILRPLLLAGAVVPLFLAAPATRGTGLALEISGACAGVLLGALAGRLLAVRRDDASGRPVSDAGAAYAALWIAVVAARSAFSYGSAHWFTTSLGRWMAENAVTGAALTDTLVLMAVAMVLTRTGTLAFRTQRLRSAVTGPAPA